MAEIFGCTIDVDNVKVVCDGMVYNPYAKSDIICDLIDQWCKLNCQNPFLVEKQVGGSKIVAYFENETDCTTFKLRWA